MLLIRFFHRTDSLHIWQFSAMSHGYAYDAGAIVNHLRGYKTAKFHFVR